MAAHDNPHYQRHRKATERLEQEFKRIAEGQRAKAEALAQRLEQGEAISRADGRLVAAVLRHWASKIPDAEKRPPGKPPEFDHELFAWDYYRLRDSDGLTDAQAKDRLATEYEIDDRHVARILKKELPGIVALFGPPRGQTPKS